MDFAIERAYAFAETRRGPCRKDERRGRGAFIGKPHRGWS